MYCWQHVRLATYLLYSTSWTVALTCVLAKMLPYVKRVHGHADIAQFLIDHGADVHAEGDEAMHEASANGHQHIVLLLTQHANVRAVDDKALASG